MESFTRLTLLLCALLLTGGCSRLDMRDASEDDPKQRLRNALSYTTWQTRDPYAAPTLYFYNKGNGRVVWRATGKVEWFSWDAAPEGQYVHLEYENSKIQPESALVAASLEELRYRDRAYGPPDRLSAVTVLLQSGQITGWLLFDMILLVVVLVVGTNLIVYLNKVDVHLKRHIKLRGSDLGYYLKTEKPELVSINKAPPLRFKWMDFHLDAHGIQVNLEKAVLLEESDTPLFEVRSGTRLRFFKDEPAAEEWMNA